MSRLRTALGLAPPVASPEPPIRSELFSLERLEEHATSLAEAQRVGPGLAKGRSLAPRLDENTRILIETFRTIAKAAYAREPITPAGEWLLDNFHVIDEQIREIKDDLPPGYYRLLPKLADGPLQGYPRIFGVAWALVAHSDSAFDMQKLTRFVDAYQRSQPLTIGELWAIAITLRITLVENLRRLAEAIGTRMSVSRVADGLADRILGTADHDPEPAVSILSSLEQIPWSTGFAVQLSQRLRDRDPDATPALRWLNERLASEGTTTDQLLRDEVQRQSALNVTVRNVISSMRLISAANWAEFFESVSPVDAILRNGSDFAAMDFPTRDLYRRAIEELARGSRHSEAEIATRAIAAAGGPNPPNADGDNSPRRENDPGYYLIADGRRGFETQLGCRVPLRTRLLRLGSDAGVTSYVVAIGLVSLALLALALFAVAQMSLGGWSLLAFAILGLVPASDVAVAAVNRSISQWVGATLLPGLELRGGIPPHLRTMVVVPTLLTEISAVREQVERLEVHHLSNSDTNFSFAILSDWRDSATEHAANDEGLLNEAAAGIAALNARYVPSGDSPRFFLLHRRRIWNEGEGKWIGWERKRGKLDELNSLLRGATDTTFLTVDRGPPSLPTDIRYVITLDSDTRLPIGAARRLVGKIAHPLNRPRFDGPSGRVLQGHGILQPRVTPSLPLNSEGSLYERVFSGPNGLDPYALAVSDVYQDLFEEGSYSGKGIYEVDVFQSALEGRIPENAVLSHDLLEGIFARAGLVSDVEVVEEFPSRYDVAAARQHRWARGDWQLLPWIFGLGPRTHDGSRQPAVPLIGRWKLLDNLRRSLSAPAALLGMLVAWTQPLPVAAIWTAYIVLTIALPPLTGAIAGIVPRRGGISLSNHLRGLEGDFVLGLVQSAFLITFLAHQAWLMVDAMGRTLFRLVVRRRLLEWVTAAQTNDDAQFDQRALWAQIAASAVFAGIAAALIAVAGHHTWWLAAPFGVLWVLSPAIARWASTPPPPRGHLSLEPADALALRLIARRTWRFFERFVTADDNMLPPDNFQEDPAPIIAHRTSPTNIGLYLLSVVAARDFGWTGTLDTVDRLETTLAAAEKLERFRGHFFNWYDTTDLRALEPKYISSVDSGNLAGHLLTLGNACHEIVAAPLCNPRWVVGLEDNLALIRAGLDALPINASKMALMRAIDAFAAELQDLPTSPAGIARCLAALAAQSEGLADLARARADEPGNGEIVTWIGALSLSIAAHRRDSDLLLPWATLVPAQILAGDEIALLDVMPTLATLPAHCEAVLQMLTSRRETSGPDQTLDVFIDALKASVDASRLLAHRLTALADLAKSTATSMEFGFLFDSERQLLSIGYRDADGSLDASFYDLLASEARLASFIAIAKGDVPAKHWFRLGRTLTPIRGRSALISWSGSMFEYLMPTLVMRTPAGSLLEQTDRLIVYRQEKYGNELGVPWGMSESEYNVRDIEQTYQYSSFGIPDIGYKRGLSENTVIAPYATGLAAMIDPAAAARNYARMAGLGARGAYGWYEALDYTRARLPAGVKFVVVRAYMAHHQAMTLVAIANALHDGAMRTRFHAEPMIQAAELLLQERTPRDVAVARPPPEQAKAVASVGSAVPETQRRYTSVHSRMPRTHILSNGQYSVMLTAAGSGYSRWGHIAVTRWREDPTGDGWGAYVFLRDVASGETWSAGYQPSVAEPDDYEVTFSEDRAEIIRRDATITTMLEVMVSPEDSAEVRRVSITNHGTRTREIEVTSYAELALTAHADDVAHPAFTKLFVETAFAPELGALLATRRPHAAGDQPIWAAHLAVVEGESSGDLQFETDRARFLGRGRTIRSPAGITDSWPLSNTTGPVLDPIISLRRRLRVAAGATVRVAFWTMVAPSREDVLALADKHHDAMAFERVTTLAHTQAQMQLRHLGISPDEAHLFQRLANHVLYSDPTLRPSADVLKRFGRKASTLWAQGISGDLPLVLVRFDHEGELELVRQLLRAHEYWKLKHLAVDLVIINERSSSYLQDAQVALDSLVRMNRSLPLPASNVPRGAVFVLRADIVSPEVQGLLQAAARAVLYGNRGTLADQLNRARRVQSVVAPPPHAVRRAAPRAPLPRPDMEFFNGLGGFTLDGREYLTILDGTERTPAPWINVIANRNFGFQVSTEGSGFTWSVNSQQNQLTPWSNDAVSDPPGEAIYVRDEQTGDVWGPTALPIREQAATYSARHGQGYTRFEHASHGIALELTQFAPVDDPIKISRLKIVNQSGRQRDISITGYVEWVLGANRAATAPYVVTEINSKTGAVFALNPWSEEFGERVAFFDMGGRQTSWTGDRTEFIGRDGALDRPLALTPGAHLSNRVGAGIDPCGVLQTRVRLAAAGTTEIVFFLGQTATRSEAEALLEKYRTADLDAVLGEVTRQWEDVLGTVQVRTPDRALDIMLNRWLAYQTLACRIWARAGFYQASGAYGFRDQLQDVMALCVSRPDIAREHLLRAAARQFVEGDVQHWWLPESGRGIRTRVSDDRVWLAYVVAHYVEVSGDWAVLDEPVSFLAGPVLPDGQLDSFFQPTISDKQTSLFDHCALALNASLATGVHGLPLIGTGDWNDGMNLVGKGGKGESVWLGWFLHSALTSFATLADRRGTPQQATEWREHATGLKTSLERDGWDGDWYRRAYFDDGAPLGSVVNNECRIDSISQSWAVISGAAEPARAARAMAAVDKFLVRRDEKLLLLFAPPFVNPAQDPGYVNGYPAGIRENGGQYTHGALWSVMAVAMQGDGDKAHELMSILNPIHHSDSSTGIHRYKVEPYVVSADIYSEPPLVGRGGWTWYTGSAGWMYNVGLEWLLGFRVRGTHLVVDPCIPREWPGFDIVFRHRSSRYEISVKNPLGVCRGVVAIKLDGVLMVGNGPQVPLADDGATHRVQVILG